MRCACACACVAVRTRNSIPVAALFLLSSSNVITVRDVAVRSPYVRGEVVCSPTYIYGERSSLKIKALPRYWNTV